MLCFTSNAQIIGVGSRKIFNSTSTVHFDNTCTNSSDSTGQATVSCVLNVANNASTIFIDSSATVDSYTGSIAGFAAPTVADTGSYGTVTMLDDFPVGWNSNDTVEYEWVLTNASAGVHTITLTLPSVANNYPYIQVASVYGASLIDPVDVNNNGNGNTALCGGVGQSDIVTDVPGEFLLAFAATSGGTFITSTGASSPSINMTLATPADSQTTGIQYGYAGAVGSYALSFNLASSTDWSCTTIAVK